MDPMATAPRPPPAPMPNMGQMRAPFPSDPIQMGQPRPGLSLDSQMRPRRNWQQQPTDTHVEARKIFAEMTDPASIWSSVSSSAVVFLVVAVILHWSKIPITLDDRTGRSSPKKILFFALVAAGATFGGSYYLRKRFN